MKKIKILLASSNERKRGREQFEIEIYRKCKVWFNKDVFQNLEIWEDMSVRMSLTSSQSKYDKFVREADPFTFFAFSKVGMYIKEEYEHAFGQFKSKSQPFIFTYFKTPPENTVDSLADFKNKLSQLKDFFC